MYQILWTPEVRRKLLTFRSEFFSAEETLKYIIELINEVEGFLQNGIVKETYKEEFGEFKGLSRMVIRKHRIYYQKDQDSIIILAILFAGES